jgi:hypothetical protein
MNDNDLERQLRAQAGPREEGYVPTRLPASPDEAALRRSSPLMRAAVFVPAVAAGVLLVAVAAAAFRGFGPGSSVGGGSPEPTPSAATTSGEPVACVADDLHIAAEPWGGAAGSRGTLVSIALTDGNMACLISRDPMGRITDAKGAEVVSSLSLGVARPQQLMRPGDLFTVGVAWSNFCGDTPPEPLSLQLRFGSMPDWVTVDESASAPTIPVAPCMGMNTSGSNLSVTDLQGAQ